MIKGEREEREREEGMKERKMKKNDSGRDSGRVNPSYEERK